MWEVQHTREHTNAHTYTRTRTCARTHTPSQGSVSFFGMVACFGAATIVTAAPRVITKPGFRGRNGMRTIPRFAHRGVTAATSSHSVSAEASGPETKRYCEFRTHNNPSDVRLKATYAKVGETPSCCHKTLNLRSEPAGAGLEERVEASGGRRLAGNGVSHI